MYCFRREPPLRDVLADPVIRAVMSADHIDPHRMADFLRDMAHRQRQPGGEQVPLAADGSSGH
jgi:hypothetical protein